MTIRAKISGLAFLAATAVSGAAFASDQAHFSQVSFAPGAGAVLADVDGTQGVVMEVGKSAELDIKYQIGWFEMPPGGGTMTQASSDIKDPQYALLWDQGTQNPSDYVPGLSFDGATGVYSGTPTAPGLWHYFPVVRDKKDGESPYDGDGFWFTVTTTWNNKTWIEPKTMTPVIVLPAVSSKAVMLACSWPSAADLLLQVDYQTGIVRIMGNDGNVAGVYHANVSEDFIAWGKTSIAKPSFGASSVKLDRKTGAFTTTADYGNGVTGSCQKRTVEQKF